MDDRTEELLGNLVDNYSDRLDEDQQDMLAELLDDKDNTGGVIYLVDALTRSQLSISNDELIELEDLCDGLDLNVNLLDRLEVD